MLQSQLDTVLHGTPASKVSETFTKQRYVIANAILMIHIFAHDLC